MFLIKINEEELFFRKPELSEEIKYFDMKLLFVITTLCSEIRYKVKEQLHGISYLIKLLNAVHDKAYKKPGQLSVSFTENSIIIEDCSEISMR